MNELLIVVIAVTAALVIGAVIGAYAPMGDQAEGMLVGVAAGALLLSLVLDLIQPAIEQSSILIASVATIAGAAVFGIVDYLVDEVWEKKTGGGLLVAVTLDGIPENLALGVALIHAGLSEVAALSASVFLSNLPEAASGARIMRDESQFSKLQAIGLWAATGAVLAAAAFIGHWALADITKDALAFISCFAAGAMAASLTTELMPIAYRKASNWAGLTTALGVVGALWVHQVAGN